MNKGKVVVIDDSLIVRKLVMATLSEEGYKVYSAEDGEEGLKLAEEVSPSIIIVDFIMPRMTGYQFCMLARDNQALRNVPVLLITSKGEDAGEQFRKKCGVCDYLIKPFEPVELVEKVNSIVQSQQAEEPSAPDTVTKEPAEAPHTADIEGAAQKGETYEKQIINAPEFAETRCTADIEGTVEKTDSVVQSQQQTEEASLQQIIKGPELAEAFHTADIEDAVERAVQRYFYKEFPSLLHKSIADVLKQSVGVKTSGIILSGEFSDLNIFDVFQLIDTTKLTGTLSVYSPATSYEVYFDKGSIVYASTSKEGKNILTGDLLEKKIGIPREVINRVRRTSRETGVPLLKVLVDEGIISENEIIVILRECIDETIYSIIDIESGNFFFEKTPVPDNLMGIPIRLKPSQIIIEGARKIVKKRFIATGISE